MFHTLTSHYLSLNRAANQLKSSQVKREKKKKCKTQTAGRTNVGQMSPMSLTELTFESFHLLRRTLSEQPEAPVARAVFPLLSAAWPAITKPELSHHSMSWGHYYHTPTSLCVCVCCYIPNQGFGSSWQGEVSAVCFGLLWKPAAESFQSSTTVLRLCCWSVQAAGNRITKPNLALLESILPS